MGTIFYYRASSRSFPSQGLASDCRLSRALVVVKKEEAFHGVVGQQEATQPMFAARACVIVFASAFIESLLIAFPRLTLKSNIRFHSMVRVSLRWLEFIF